MKDWAYVQISSQYGTVKLQAGNGTVFWQGTSGKIYTSQDKIPQGETGTYMTYGSVEGFTGNYVRMTSTGTSYGIFEFFPD